MKTLKFTESYKNKRGQDAHKSGTICNSESGIYMYGFDRIPRKLKKLIKSFCKPLNKMIWVFSKPDKIQIKDPSFMWLETFKTII